MPLKISKARDNKSLRILILHGGALGDCALTLHLAIALRSQLDSARLAMAARSRLPQWAKQQGHLNETVPFDSVAPALFGDTSGAPFQLASELLNHFDWVISFLGGPHEAVSRRLSEVHLGRSVAIDPRPSPETIRSGEHITQQWWRRLVSFFGDRITLQRPTAGIIRRVPAGRHEWTDRMHFSPTSPVILVHPGSGGTHKCCPIDALESLAAQLQSRAWGVAWMVGPDELERFGVGFRSRLERTAPVLCEELVDSAAELVRSADAFVGNDAGMTHVAALAGVGTVAIFGPTDPRIWRPIGQNVNLFEFPKVDDCESWVHRVEACIMEIPRVKERCFGVD